MSDKLRPRFVAFHAAPDAIQHEGDAGYAVYERERISHISGRTLIDEEWCPVREGATCEVLPNGVEPSIIRPGDDLELTLYRISRLSRNFAMRAWALGELRARWNGPPRTPRRPAARPF
jgi:hypothetical protein